MMTAQSHTTQSFRCMAIDISKDWSDAALELSDSKIKLFRFRHRFEDIQKVIADLKKFNHPIRLGFEATGDYHRAIVEQFHKADFETVLLSSVAAARFREATFGTTDKNDKKDSVVLLKLMQQGIVQRYFEPSHSEIHNYRELSMMYHQVTRARTQAQHQLLTHFLPLYFPEIIRYWKSSRTHWIISLLEQFPTPRHVRELSREDFLEICLSFFKRRNSVQVGKFNEIHAMAHTSLGLDIPSDSLALELFRMHLNNLKQLEQKRTLLERKANLYLDTHPDFKILTTLPGVGTIHALSIVAEAGDLRRFSHNRQFLKYCGFDLKKQQSGHYRGKETLSKRGNAVLRKTFWMAACTAIRARETAFWYQYRRYMEKDPSNGHLKRKALTAVAVKMARVAYALVKNGTPYYPSYECQNSGGMTSINRYHGGTIVIS